MGIATHWLLCLAPLACVQTTSDSSDARQGVVVQGVVRDGQTQQPLAEVELLLSTGSGEVAARSDAAGQFQALIRPGFLTGRVTRVPSGYAFGLRAFRQPIEIDESTKEATLPPIELRQGRTVRGKVVDRQGEPAAGATVQIVWRATSPWLDSALYTPRSSVSTSDERGEFTFDGIDRFADPRLTERFARLFVNRGDATLDAPQAMPADDRLPALLRLEHDRGVSLSGRMSDSEGKPIDGVQAEVWVQWRADNHVVLGNGPLVIAGAQKMEIDSAGRFQTAPCLSPGGEYAVLFTAPGCLPARTPWARPSEAGDLVLPETRMRRLRTIAGRIVDAEDQPVAGARVFQSGDGVERTETTSDADGRFTLAGVAEGTAIVFVEQAGFHFYGQPVTDDADIELSLRPISAAAAPLSGAPAALSREEELQLARAAYRPLLDRTFSGKGSSDQSGVLWHWARIDPIDALGYIDRAKLPNADAEEYDIFRLWVAKRLVRDSLEEALAVAESIHDPDRRVRALVDMVGRLAPSQRGERRQLLDQALLDAGQAQSPALRAIWLHVIADCLLDLGEADRARELLDDARATVATLPVAGEGATARGYVAEVLARIDLAAGLELASTLTEDDYYRDTTYGRIASRIAARQPAEAEKALDRIRDPYRRDGFCVRVCCRAAPADPKRARRLAGQIVSPYLRAYALGLMARSVAESQPAQARAWLDEAFALLARIAAANEERLADVKLSAALVAGLLLPAAEKVDANSLPDYCWRALSFRRPHSASDEAGVIESTAGLLMCLAPYNHRIARLLAEPLIADVAAGKLAGGTLSDYVAYYTACVIDPRWAVELLDQLPEIESAASTFRSDLAFALGAPPENRLRTLFGNYLHLWWPDDPDNAFQQVD